MFLCRTYVDDDLLRTLRCKYIKNLRKHLHCCAHRHREDYQITLLNAFLQRHHPVGQTDLLSGGGIQRFRLDAEDLLRKALALEVDGHGSAYKSQSYDSYLHIYKIDFILSAAFFSTSGLAQREMRM